MECSGIKLKLQRHIHVEFLLLLHLLVAVLLLATLFLGLLLNKFPALLLGLAVCLESLVYPLAPVLADLLGNPGLDLDTWHPLHAEYFESRVVPACVGIGHSLDDQLVVVGAAVVRHRVDG